MKMVVPIFISIIVIILLGCPNPLSSPSDKVINIADISGVNAPVFGATPVSRITETEQFKGSVAWSPAVSDTFAANTTYTATLTLTAKNGYTLKGVAADFFSVAGAASDANEANSGVVTAVFPATGSVPATVITIAEIPGVTAPVTGSVPVTAITGTAQYTGVVAWSPAVNDYFAAGTEYAATITLTAKPGYTMSGVAANFFTVAGAASDVNDANSGVVTAIFPETETSSDTTISIMTILGIPAPAAGTIPVFEITETAQYTGSVEWSHNIEDMFISNISYTATISLYPKPGYTLEGLSEDSFVVPGAIATFDPELWVVSAKFPKTTANLQPLSDVASSRIGTLKAVQGGTFFNET